MEQANSAMQLARNEEMKQKIKDRISAIDAELKSIPLSEENRDKIRSLYDEQTELTLKLMSLGPKFEEYKY